jgi:hypothetical protein
MGESRVLRSRAKTTHSYGAIAFDRPRNHTRRQRFVLPLTRRRQRGFAALDSVRFPFSRAAKPFTFLNLPNPPRPLPCQGGETSQGRNAGLVRRANNAIYAMASAVSLKVKGDGPAHSCTIPRDFVGQCGLPKNSLTPYPGPPGTPRTRNRELQHRHP